MNERDKRKRLALCSDMERAGIGFSRLMDARFRIGSDNVSDFLDDKHALIKETKVQTFVPEYIPVSVMAGVMGSLIETQISSFFIIGIGTFSLLMATHVGIGLIWIGLKKRKEGLISRQQQD
ncbi:MAG: hypothetical protein ABII22_03770 [Candidatus Micrarchaeota archaeon]